MNFFLDFDKKKELFYNNYWIDDEKVVVKMPIQEGKEKEKDIKIEEFNLSSHVYLLAY